jgi:hypothetical protein
MSDDGNPRDLRWAEPDYAAKGQRELIIAIGNLTAQVMRIADVQERLYYGVDGKP